MKNYSIVIISLFLILLFSMKVQAEDSLYFDQEGNLIFATYDKLATGGTKYKTIGWYIKRYEGGLFMQGQQKALIPVPSSYYEVVDASNPGYVYSYFIISKESMRSKISEVSTSWWEQLSNYGGRVYLDSVMTVTVNGVLKGNIGYDGSFSGEVYYSYQGISTARAWADKYKLLSYFDIPVEFLMQDNRLYLRNIENASIDYNIKSKPVTKVVLSSKEYDVLKGIPSGKEVIIKGIADSFICDLNFIYNSGIAYIPVKVNTRYILSWINYKGVRREEIRDISRYYYVPKQYSYYSLSSTEVLSADFFYFYSDGISSNKTIVNKTNLSFRNYGGFYNHVTIPAYSITTSDVYLYGYNYLRPDIPNDNYSYNANAVVSNVNSNSDYLKVGDILYLDDTKMPVSGKIPNKNAIIPKVEFLIEGKKLEINTPNGSLYHKMAYFLYKNSSREEAVFCTDFTDLIVHTPIYNDAYASVKKDKNMAINPKKNQIVVDEDFSMNSMSIGMHLDYRGYGYRDYSEYIKGIYYRFPFDVVKDGIVYKKNTLVSSEKGISTFNFAENIELGDYVIESFSYAYNSSGEVKNTTVFGAFANMNKEYFVRNEINVEVIGSMMDFCIKDNSKDCYILDMPKSINYNNFYNNLELSITSHGHGRYDNDYIRGDIKAFYIDEKGSRKELKIYSKESGSNVGVSAIFTERTELSIGEFLWTGNFNLSKDYYYLDGEKKISPSRYKIIFNIDIRAFSNEEGLLSYINLANYKNGYCNKWKEEGITTDYEYGDFIVFNENLKKEDYEIIGIY